MTKTNIGIDIDNKPPTAEVSIARREVAIQPTFPVRHQAEKNSDGSTPIADSSSEELSLPLLASFGLEGNILSPRINGSGWDNNEKFIGFDGKLKHIQFFATGSAATEFVKRASVKFTAFENMAPDAAKMESKSLNSALIKDIQNAFHDADANKRDNVLKKSIGLALVPNDTTVDNFLEKLQAQADSVNFSVSTKLNQLRMEAQQTGNGL